MYYHYYYVLGPEQCQPRFRPHKATDMASSPRVYGRLRNFRAGMEAVVSYLKGSVAVTVTVACPCSFKTILTIVPATTMFGAGIVPCR